MFTVNMKVYTAEIGFEERDIELPFPPYQGLMVVYADGRSITFSAVWWNMTKQAFGAVVHE